MALALRSKLLAARSRSRAEWSVGCPVPHHDLVGLPGSPRLLHRLERPPVGPVFVDEPPCDQVEHVVDLLVLDRLEPSPKTVLGAVVVRPAAQDLAAMAQRVPPGDQVAQVGKDM